MTQTEVFAGGSEKHLRDIGAMLRQSANGLDLATLEALVDERGLGSGWRRAQEEVDRAP